MQELIYYNNILLKKSTFNKHYNQCSEISHSLERI